MRDLSEFAVPENMFESYNQQNRQFAYFVPLRPTEICFWPKVLESYEKRLYLKININEVIYSHSVVFLERARSTKEEISGGLNCMISKG